MEKERLLNYIDLFRKKSEKNKLVIFVGSGVSLNVKGMPSWSKIIKTMAKEINYSKCINCKKSNECGGDCPLIEEYSTDEFLKIPQYLYNQDKNLYYEILKNSINNNIVDAPLSSVIFKINPIHIITTNYDNLLESSEDILRTQYQCIIKDKDLLNIDKSKYIIKIHGDLSELDTIVLKEDDYLNYSQNHILIESFVKSLFINHTIMFLGYSLSDYNIKLIISWINYMRLKNNISDNEKIGYIVLDSDNKEIDKNEINYFAQNNIEVININNITCVDEIPDSLSDDKGKRLYSFLQKIIDPSLEKGVESIKKAVKFMSRYSFISYSKLLNILNIKSYRIEDNKLYLNNNGDYEILEKTMSENTNESKQLKQLFINSGILIIYTRVNNKTFNIGEFKENKIFDNKLFDLYLHNKYYELKLLLDNSECDLIEKQFYTSIIQGYNGFEKFNYRLNRDELVKLNIDRQVAYIHNIELIESFKIKGYFNTKGIRKFINNIEYSEERNLFSTYIDIYDGDLRENLNMLETLEKSKINSHKFYLSGDYLSEIRKIKINVLDRYLFYHFNNVIYQGFTNTYKIFKPFIETIMYANAEHIEKPKYFGSNIRIDKKYKLDILDCDIITKFISPMDLNNIIIKYKVFKLNIDEDVSYFLVGCFKNLCDYIFKSKNYDFIEYSFSILSNIALLLKLINLDDNCKEDITYTIEGLFKNLDIVKYIFSHLDYDYFFYIFSNLCESLKNSHNISVVKNIIIMITSTGEYLNEDTFNSLKKIVMKFLCKDINLQYEIMELVDKENNFENKVAILRLVYKSIIDESISQKYIDFLSSNFHKLDPYTIYDFVFNNWLNPSEKEINMFLKNIVIEYQNNKNSRVRSYPDLIKIKLRCVCILYINNIIKDISILKELENELPYLKFLFNQDNFDYTQVNFSDYMWVRFSKIPKYMKKFIEYKNDLIPKLKERIKNSNATENEKKILYFHLLEKEDDLWEI